MSKDTGLPATATRMGKGPPQPSQLLRERGQKRLSPHQPPAEGGGQLYQGPNLQGSSSPAASRTSSVLCSAFVYRSSFLFYACMSFAFRIL